MGIPYSSRERSAKAILMSGEGTQVFVKLLTEAEAPIFDAWMALLKVSGSLQSGRIREAELQTQARSVLKQLLDGLSSGSADTSASGFAPLRETLSDISRTRAVQGFTPTETANFVFSLKEPIFDAMNHALPDDARAVAAGTWSASRILDQLAVLTMEAFQAGREEVISRQSQEIAELSTPVVQLWDGILALPLIGTLDSARTGVVMENLLQAIVDEEAEIAIIDITGVPTVDTLVAQHLLKTIAAARLMGADCIISGIRPQIAQTMVHLGVELNVVSKATRADAFALALRRTGRVVTRQKLPASPDGAR
jgi:rsbT co-antagonist protein RsbR